MKENRNKYKGLSYGELVSIRRDLQDDIQEYEIYMNKGAHLSVEFIDVPMSEKEYKSKLKELSKLTLYMSDKYTLKTPMVDETTPESMLSFAIGTFWFEERGNNALDIDNAEIALEYLNRLSDEGNAEAQNTLGALYYEGNYVEQNYKLAAQYYIAAAKNGHSLAMSNTGYCYYYGNGVEQDYTEAYKYFSKAAGLGEYDAMNMLGDMYRDGKFVEEDKNMAFKIYKEAYDKIPQKVFEDACPQNLMRIGECLLKGYGCKQDKETAVRLLKDAKEMFELQIDYGRGMYAEHGLEQVNKLLRENNAEVIIPKNTMTNKNDSLLS